MSKAMRGFKKGFLDGDDSFSTYAKFPEKPP